MARTVKNIRIEDEGRDLGKTFVLTELPASRAEAWAIRALMALVAGNVDIPAGVERMGMAGMAEVGIKAIGGLKWEIAEPLLDEMWACVQILTDSGVVRPLIETDVEEILTRVKLRAEVWKLHAGFFPAAAPLPSGSGPAAGAGQNTKTSQRRAAR